VNADVEKLLIKARRSLASAARETDDGNHDFAASRGYYAMFYTAEALLLHLGLAFTKHSAVIAEFNRLFVRPKLFDPRHARALRESFEDRQVGDYDYRESVPAETASRIVRDADAFISAAEEWLREQPEG
jgi:uncharacterized protein (UPF0332 family)